MYCGVYNDVNSSFVLHVPTLIAVNGDDDCDEALTLTMNFYALLNNPVWRVIVCVRVCLPFFLLHVCVCTHREPFYIILALQNFFCFTSFLSEFVKPTHNKKQSLLVLAVMATTKKTEKGKICNSSFFVRTHSKHNNIE